MHIPEMKTPQNWERTVPRTLEQWQAVYKITDPGPCSKAQLAERLDYVRTMFEYDPVTGILHWATMRPGDSDRQATRVVQGTGKVYPNGIPIAAAHIVWMLHHGVLPPGQLRRRNGDTTDDRIENLYDPRGDVRPTLPVGLVEAGWRPPAEPQGVFAGSSQKRRGRGVARYGADRWQAYASVNCKQIGLGRYKTEAEAIAARARWEAQQAVASVDDLV